MAIVMRIEIDNLAWEMNVKVRKPLKVTLYLPYGYVSTSRKCSKLTLTDRPCQKECQRYFLKVKDKISHVDFYGMGNSIFFKTQIPSEVYLRKIGVDRIVYQPKLTFC